MSVKDYTAAGGVLLDPPREKVLLLIRPSRDEIRLPKGHVESDESERETALREVSEESGFDDLEILSDLGEQLVVFSLEDDVVRRTEHYYLMRARTQHRRMRPEPDASQFITRWVSWQEAREHLTFEAEREWLRRAHQALEINRDPE
jgi:8-oxo-dGTP pyrophosphatase MutT (NUDIX family)